MGDDWLPGKRDEDDIPDWLRDDESPQAAQERGEDVPAEGAADEIPDWLSSVLGVGTEAPGERESAPDWLTSETPTSLSGDETSAGGDRPAWLSGEDTPGEATPLSTEALTFDAWQAEQETESEPADPLLEEVPDWFEEAEQQAPEPTAEPVESPFAPEWFMGLEEQRVEGAPDWFHEASLADDADLLGDTDALADRILGGDVPTGEAVPDWFRDVEPPPTQAAGDVLAGTDEPADEALPDWMAALGGREEPAEPEAIPAPDWAAEPVDEAAEVEEPVATAEPADEALPDWMAALDGGEEPAEPEAIPAPDWAAESDDETAGVEEPVGAAEPADEAVPDWMAALTGEEPAREAEPTGAEGPLEAAKPVDEALPDWMAALVGEGEPAEPEAVPSPDWLEALGSEPPQPADEDVPDWLAVVDSALAEQALAGTTEAPASAEPAGERELPTTPLLDEEMPDWLAELRPEALDVIDGAVEEGEALEEGEVPEWLEAARPSDRFERLGVSAPPEVEVPAWVEALSPAALSQAAGPEQAGGEESAGPLAGLRGALPAEPLMSVPGAPELTTSLTVTDREHNRARLLESIVGELFPEIEEEEEGEPRKDKARRARPRKRLPLGRVMLSALLAVALIAPFFLPPGVLQPPSPPAMAAPALDAYAQIERVGRGDLVLVAFEHGAAEAVELESGARAVLAHLADRGARLMTLTTNPVGVMVGHRLVDEIAGDARPAPVDLGYLAGYLGGLRSLVARDVGMQAEPPARFGFDFRGDATNLNVRSMRESIKLIVLLPGQYEAMRAWLEQVGSVTGREDAGLPGVRVPMVAVVGAGIEPLAAAYWESGQLDGYVAGYAGALAYAERRGGAEEPFVAAEARQLSIAASIAVAVVVIALGNLWYALRGLLTRRRPRG